MKPNDAEVTVERGRLTIRAKKEEDEEAKPRQIKISVNSKPATR